MRKIISFGVAALLIGGAAGSLLTMYFVEWNEPAAAYEETDNPKLLDVRDRLAALKEELRQQGKYRCCIKGDCNWCAIYMGHCPCEDLVREKGKEQSCPECAAAWNRKRGKIPGVDPDAIGVTTFGVYGHEKGGHHGPEGKPESDAHGAHSGAEQHKASAEPAHGLSPSGDLVGGIRVVKMSARKFQFAPATIVVKRGETVRLEVTSEDVTHGIGIEDYDIDRKLEPKKTESITFTADKPGRHRFYCSVYCGTGHTDMHGELIVIEKE